jgi:hypothetical protein
MFLGGDMLMSLVATSWDYKNKHLYIYGEYSDQSSAVSTLSNAVKIFADNAYKIYGNEAMFSKGEDVAMKLRKTGIKIDISWKFDLPASIMVIHA